MRLMFPLIILALALVLVAACGGDGEEEALFLQDPEAVLLQIGEVPGNFLEVEDSRRHVSNEASCAGAEGSEQEECMSNLEEWGRLDGVEVEYLADDPTAFYAGVYDVFNSVSIYRDPKGAKDAFRNGLERLEEGLSEMEDATRVDIESVGEESAAFAVTSAQEESGVEVSVTLYVVDFRRGNTLARIGAAAPTALANVDDAVTLAKQVDQRILRVSSETPPTFSPTAAATENPAPMSTAVPETATTTPTGTASP